jgi:hypothetical protein
MRVLVCYSNAYRAQEAGFPAPGAVLEISALEDILALHERFSAETILHRKSWTPWWADFDADPDDWRSPLPDDWRDLLWLEIYNGYRE